MISTTGCPATTPDWAASLKPCSTGPKYSVGNVAPVISDSKTSPDPASRGSILSVTSPNCPLPPAVSYTHLTLPTTPYV